MAAQPSGRWYGGTKTPRGQFLWAAAFAGLGIAWLLSSLVDRQLDRGVLGLAILLVVAGVRVFWGIQMLRERRAARAEEQDRT